jgi:hypothetical protein
VDEGVIELTSLLWIGCDVLELIAKVLCVAYSVLVEAGLPDFSRKLRSYFMREAAFDALGAALDGLSLGWGQQNM